VPEKEVKKLLSELESAGVFSRDEQGIIYSRKMVRDVARAVRNKANGQYGGNPQLKSDNRNGAQSRITDGLTQQTRGLGKPYYPLSSPRENLSVGDTLEGTDEDAPFGREGRH
jgi:hypothetical protein